MLSDTLNNRPTILPRFGPSSLAYLNVIKIYIIYVINKTPFIKGCFLDIIRSGLYAPK